MESLGIPDLGPFKLVQAALAFAIVGTAIIVWLRGSNNRTDSKPVDSGVQVYMGGPLQAAQIHFKLLAESAAGIYRLLGEIRSDVDRNASEMGRRKEAELEILRDMRDGRSRPKRRK